MAFDLLIGRITFDNWASYWPHHADIWPGIQSGDQIVASNTLSSSERQPTVFLSGDVAGRIREIRDQPGPDLHVYGSGDLVQTLLRHDLVNDLWLKICPLTLGAGKRLFAGGSTPIEFALTTSQVTPRGVIVANYVRVGALQVRNM